MQKTGLNKTINYCIPTFLFLDMSSEKTKIQVSKFNQNQPMSLPGKLYCCPHQGDRIPVRLVANEMCVQSNSSSLWILTRPTLLLHKQVELLPLEDGVRSSPYLLFHCTWPQGLCHWVHSAWHTWLGGDWLAVTWLPTHNPLLTWTWENRFKNLQPFWGLLLKLFT